MRLTLRYAHEDASREDALREEEDPDCDWHILYRPRGYMLKAGVKVVLGLSLPLLLVVRK